MMWRMLNNISRVFRTHIYNPRPTAGVLVDEDQERDHAGQGSHSNINEHGNNTELNKEEQWHCHGNLNAGDGNEGQNLYHHNFWNLLLGSNMYQPVTLGPVFIWGVDRNNWKQKTSSGLLYHILFALPGRFSPAAVRSILPTIKEERLHQAQPQSGQLAIKDAAGAALDQKINASKSETLEVAVKEFQKVCREYSACSQSVLGLQAANGGDMPTAVEHLQRSCLLGNLSACFNLGLCYETGSGVPHDETKAIYYYQKAAKGGHKQALYNLGLLCLKQSEEGPSGTSARENLREKSAIKGSEKSGLSKEMGLDFLEEAARLGLPEAQTYLGLYLMEECQQPVKAVSYFKAAAIQNDSEAQYLLAMCYEQGLGVDTNECLAARFYSLAAQTGHNLALYNLGVFNEEGLGGLPKNKTNAVEMYRKAAKLGSVEAEERLMELFGSDRSNSTNSNITSEYEEGNIDKKRTTLAVFDQSEEGSIPEDQETGPEFDNSAGDNPFLPFLSPSSSFPSLRSLSSYSVPVSHVKPTRMSSSQHAGLKFVVQDSSGSSIRASATDKSECFLRKVNFFLDMSPTSMTLDHDMDIPYGSLSVSHSIPVSSFRAEEEGAENLFPTFHRSHSSTDFSMIGI